MSDASKITGYKDMTVGSMKETIGTMTGNQKLELTGKAQKVHGKNEIEFASAYHSGQSEPEKFAQAYHHESTEPEPEVASSVSGVSNQVIGGIKEGFGHVTGNQQTELVGKAQKVHGRNEAEYAKAQKDGSTEPQDFIKGVDSAEGSIEGDKISSISAAKDRVVGGIKQTIGSVTGNQNMELLGKAQSVHGRNESEFAKAEKQGLNEPEHFGQGTKTTDHAEGSIEGDKASSISGLADRAIGNIKETVGSITGNQNMELLGKAQSVHGRNESEFAKAEKQGLNEPEHFVQGTKSTDHAEGTVEGDKASSLSAMKDRVVGGIKETVGSMTGNLETELVGKAQKVHGRNEAEFAHAQKQGLNEPEHFVQGTKTTDHAEGSIEGDKTSSISGFADRAIGNIKETVGSITGNQNMELLGKAQSVHGRNESEFAKAEKHGLNEPVHFVQGTKTTEHAQGTVEDSASSVSGLADRTAGAFKEVIGSATGNQKMELLGKAQNVHGRNEAEFAKAQKDGLNEPAGLIKPVEPAQGSVDKNIGQTGFIDSALGSVKESFGSATGNQQMELMGKAQKVHAKNVSDLAKAENESANA